LSWRYDSRGKSDRDRVVVSCLLAVIEVSQATQTKSELNDGRPQNHESPRHCSKGVEDFVDLRSGTSLAALTLESTNSLLAPLVTHFVGCVVVVRSWLFLKENGRTHT
jgi:hypothetical protein